MAVSNSSSNQYPHKISVSTLPNSPALDDPSMEFPLFTFKCNIKVSYVPERPDKSIRSYIPHHDSKHEFQHQLTKDHQSTRIFLSNIFGDNSIIPFSLGNLVHWKKRDYDKESILLKSVDEIVSSMLDLCHEMVAISGRKKMCLLVFIKKEVIVPRDEYIAVLKAQEAEEVLLQVQDMVQLRAQRGWDFRRSDWEAMVNVIRRDGLGNSIRDALRVLGERATTESMMSRQALNRMVAAAETSIQALEKVTYNSFNNEQKSCPVCMEEILLDSQVTRMPCSHVFHGDCIVQWLNTSHTCPVCRFKLPTAN